MAKHKWTRKEEERLIELYKSLSCLKGYGIYKDISRIMEEEFNTKFNPKALSNKIARMKYLENLEVPVRYHYTDEEKEFLKEIYYGLPYTDIADAMSIKFEREFTITNVRYLMQSLGLKNERDTKFHKGYTYNECVPIGTVSFRESIGLNYIKVSMPNTWKPYSRYVWEQHNGPIPKGKCIIHLDHNPANDELDNLMLVDSFGVIGSMNKNNLYSTDKEVTRAGALLCSLDIKLKKIDK